MNKKKSLFFVIFIFCFQIFAVSYSEKSWRILEQAQVCFDSKNYGDAFKYANQALSLRKEESENEYNILDAAISPVQVRKAGKEFSAVMPVLKEREQKEALSILDKYLKLYGNDFFKNDIHNLLEWLKNRSVYPEADFLIGKIYQLEGEYSLAQNFYERAYEEKEYLDIADVKYEILYSIAFISKMNGDDEQLEKVLLLILDNDESFKNELLKDSILRTIYTNKKDSADRLFLLYRSLPKYSLNALTELSALYQKQGELKKSLSCTSIAVIEAFTYIFNSICERNSQFKYTNISDFFNECGKYEEIAEWARLNNIWELFYQLAVKAENEGNKDFSESLYKAMAQNIPDEYYRTLASKKIKS